MFQFSLNCTEALIYSRDAYEELYTFYDELESEATRQRGRADEERALRIQTQEKLALENKRKKRWRKAAVVQGVGIVGFIALVLLL